jgi:methionyl-tRNA formyltransferase
MIDFLRSLGDEVVHTEKRFNLRSGILQGVNFILSYGYRYILSEEVLRAFPGHVVNMHISYLPWNRGKDPNLWSFLEDTPKGVTIHFIDPGIDTGDILAQEQVEFYPNDTLRTTYARLSERIEALFMRIWPDVKAGRQPSIYQPSGGSFHFAADKAEVEHLLHSGWDTPITDLIGRRKRDKAGF